MIFISLINLSGKVQENQAQEDLEADEEILRRLIKQKEREEMEQELQNKPIESKSMVTNGENGSPEEQKAEKKQGEEEKQPGDESSTLEYDPHNLDKALNRLANGLGGLGPDNVKKRYQPRASKVMSVTSMMKTKLKKNKTRAITSQENFRVSEEELTGENILDEDDGNTPKSKGKANSG